MRIGRTCRRGCGARRRAGGQVLLIVLICIAVLVGLIFYVYNAGTQINRRVGAQHAADAAAVSGGTWMARSMNVVAMNNVTQSRLIALVAVLDALPLAAEMTIAEETGEDSLPKGLEKWRHVGSPFTPQEKDNFFRRGLAELYRQMNPGNRTDLDLLAEIDGRLDHHNEKETEGGFAVEQVTQWSDGSGWQAMIALDELSQALVDSSGVLSQADAVRFGERNHADAAFLVPIVPRMPARRTRFADFGPVLLDHIVYGWQNPHNPAQRQWVNEVRSSNLVERLAASQDVPWDARLVRVRGGAIPDFAYPHRLGPFARVYRWRSHWGEYTQDYERRYVQAWGYTTWGPFENALQTVLNQFGLAGSHGGTVDTSRFAFHLRTLAHVKLAYLFGLPSPKTVQYADRWILDYNEARQYAEDHRQDRPPPVMTTRYYRVHVKSTARWDDRRNWMETYDPTPPTQTFTPLRYYSHQLRTPKPPPFSDVSAQPLYRWIEDRRGWRDATAGRSWERLADYVWIRKYTSQAVWDRELGLPPRYRTGEDGELVLDDGGQPIPIPYTIHHVEWRVFGGIELREEIDLSNPAEGASPDELPAPVLMDHTGEDGELIVVRDAEGGEGQAVRMVPFAFLGVARKHDRAPIWRQKFSGANPLGGMVTLAELKLFNPSSWDLWTQDWQVQLTPVQQWEDWVDRIEQGIADAPATGGMVDPELLEAVHEYLSNLDPGIAGRYLNH